MSQPVLAAREISKAFGRNEVLKGIEFEIYPGAGVALCGENGAGKSTLIKILTGLYSPTAGQVEFMGQAAVWGGPRESLAAGIAVIHQEFSTIGALTVAENIFLEAEPRGLLGLIDRKRLVADARALLSGLGITLDPNITVDRLSVADKQMVEIAKALRTDAKVLILDEPTAVLSQNETAHLFKLIKDLRAKGIGIVYVSHRLDEIFEVCSDITVIKDGVVTSQGPIENYTHDKVVAAMVGRELGDLFPPKADAASIGPALLGVENLRVTPDSPAVALEVHKGEIVGLAGLVGSGRTELALAIYGAERSSGTVHLAGAPYEQRSPAESLARGMVLLTESRKDDGLFGASSVGWNLAATTLGAGASSSYLPSTLEEERAGPLIDQFNVVVDHPGLPITALSGGNQQKILLGRILENEPVMMLLDEPTRGVDVGAKSEIYRAIRKLANDGMAVLVISSELIEIVGLCDRVYVMRDGEIADHLSGSAITEEAIIAVAAAETASHHGVSGHA